MDAVTQRGVSSIFCGVPNIFFCEMDVGNSIERIVCFPPRLILLLFPYIRAFARVPIITRVDESDTFI